MNKVNRIGQLFGRLRVLNQWRISPKANTGRCKCQCLCGKIVVVRTANLVSGTTTSCGCYRKEILHQRKQSDSHIRISAVGRYYKRNAKLRDIDWFLSRKEVEALIVQQCYYCGTVGSMEKKRYIGIDRIDNTEGYTVQNSVPCCWKCNAAKSDMSLEEFKEWIKRVFNYMKEK